MRLDQRLWIAGPEIAVDWDLFDLVAGDTVAPLMRIGPRGRPARVEVSDSAFADALTARCPDLHRSDDKGSGGNLRLVVWSIVAGLSVILLAIYGVPAIAARLAPMIPISVESRLGSAVADQVGRMLGHPPVCDDGPARAVLDRLVARMAGERGLPGEPRIAVHRHAVANALTLPGGRVIILSSLIDRSETADEFAGILAHEFGHIAARDPMRALLAASGSSFLLSLVLGDLTGSTLIVATGQMALSAGYSRDAETAADAYAVETLRRSGGDAGALATILERIARDEEPDGVASLLRSHPFTRERAHRIRTLAGKDTVGRHILTDADWLTLKRICRSVATAAPR
nr:M48 family metallopeptidase [Methylobacterium sp. 37f]